MFNKINKFKLNSQVIQFQEIERFINEAEHGVIYVNLGSSVKDSTLPIEKLNELVSTFRKLPLRVLFKWDGANLENLPRNVMTMRWFPQYDILSEYSISARESFLMYEITFEY